MFAAKILADSINPSNSRLVTMELTYPRCIHAEFMTHRMFSRNAASSRAIPIKKMLDAVIENPFIPIHWGANQKGMQADSVLSYPNQIVCKETWLEARDHAVRTVKELDAFGLHKQIANRLLEPWMWITVIATGVGHAWENFFKLRCHHAAEPHIQKIAYMSRGLFDGNLPKKIDNDGYHLPLIGFDGDEELCKDDLRKVSVARCARVSYLTHAGERDVEADIQLHDRLAEAGHWSPFEHVAQAVAINRLGGNFGVSWEQYRKVFVEEYCVKAPR